MVPIDPSILPGADPSWVTLSAPVLSFIQKSPRTPGRLLVKFSRLLPDKLPNILAYLEVNKAIQWQKSKWFYLGAVDRPVDPRELAQDVCRRHKTTVSELFGPGVVGSYVPARNEFYGTLAGQGWTVETLARTYNQSPERISNAVARWVAKGSRGKA